MLVQGYLATHELDIVKMCVQSSGLWLSFLYNIATKLSLCTAYKQIYIFIVINSTGFLERGMCGPSLINYVPPLTLLTR